MSLTVKSPKLYLILLLALTTIGGAVLSWQQYQELVELRAIAMNRDERADLQKKVWALEKHNRELDTQVAGLRALSGDDPAGGLVRAGDPNGKGGRHDRGPGGPGGPGSREAAAVQNLLTKPEVQALLSLQQKAAVDARYAALFKNLNFAPEQLEKFKSLLADRGNTLLDIFSVARDQGIDPRQDPEGFRKLMTGAQDDFNTSLKSVIGDAAFAQYQNFEQTQAQRNVVSQLQQRLSYTDTPLTSAQAEQMVQILAANTPPARHTNATGATAQAQPVGGPPPAGGMDLGGLAMLVGGGGPPGGGGLGGLATAGRIDSAPITTNAVNQSQAVLSAPQFAALQQLQQQQQAQQQLQQIMRDTVMAAQNGAGGATPPPTAPPTKKGGG